MLANNTKPQELKVYTVEYRSDPTDARPDIAFVVTGQDYTEAFEQVNGVLPREIEMFFNHVRIEELER